MHICLEGDILTELQAGQSRVRILARTRIFLFSKMSKSVLRPTYCLIQWVPKILSLWVKQLRCAGVYRDNFIMLIAFTHHGTNDPGSMTCKTTNLVTKRRLKVLLGCRMQSHCPGLQHINHTYNLHQCKRTNQRWSQPNIVGSNVQASKDHPQNVNLVTSRNVSVKTCNFLTPAWW
jgi:hypothetical protein